MWFSPEGLDCADQEHILDYILRTSELIKYLMRIGYIIK